MRNMRSCENPCLLGGQRLCWSGRTLLLLQTHLHGLAVADEQAGAAEASGGGVAAGAVGLADALCCCAAPAAAGAVLLTAQLLLTAEVAGDACGGQQGVQHTQACGWYAVLRHAGTARDSAQHSTPQRKRRRRGPADWKSAGHRPQPKQGPPGASPTCDAVVHRATSSCCAAHLLELHLLLLSQALDLSVTCRQK